MMNKEVQDSLKQVGIRMVEEPPLLSCLLYTSRCV